MKKILLLVACIIVFSETLSAKTSLAINKGTMELKGSILLPITIPKGGGATVGIHVAPGFAYFITRSLALEAGFMIARDSITGDNTPWGFELTGGGSYLFDLAATVYPYVGVAGGVAWKTQSRGTFFNLKFPVGILIALNTRVALDVGIPTTFVFNQDGFIRATVPVGYLGVRAYF